VTVPEPGTGETEKGIPKLSAAAPRAGEIEVRLVAPGGARELRERHRSERSATIDVPPGWLVPGRYQVALQRLGAGLVMDEAHFAFDVEPETGPER